MPWVKKDMCTGCGLCVDECPADAITILEDARAHISEEDCIRCGACHDVCPQQAVRHDKERIPLDVKANLAKVKRLMEHYDSEAGRHGFLERMVRYFDKERKVAGNTVAAIEKMQVEAG